jgi:exodeoxyribonuclease VII large subunit
VTVQGFEAAQQVADAIKKLDQRKEVDEIIVARGGGSREDLWVFNAEMIARAAYRCKKPLISAIGHEIDYTILDFVADLRAPTPSAAAELVMPDMEAELREIRRSYSNICKEIQNRLQLCYNRVRDIETAPQLAAARSLPLGLLRELSEKADAARTAMHGKMDAAKGRVAHAAMLCGSLSPYSVLARGYSIARKAGSVLKSSADASEGDRVEVQLAAGRLGCRVETIITEEEL